MKKQLIKIVAASVLADGFVGRSSLTSNARYSITQKIEHQDYVDYLANYLETLTTLETKNIPAASYEIKGKMCNITEHVGFRTKVHPLYTQVHERSYLNKIKRIDPHMLTFVDAEFMAIWFQEDGYSYYKHDSPNPYATVELCTDCFTYGDLELARKAIIEKTGFIFNTHRRTLNKNGEQTYRLSIYRKQSDKFLEYIKPFIVPSFEYKLKIGRWGIEYNSVQEKVQSI